MNTKLKDIDMDLNKPLASTLVSINILKSDIDDFIDLKEDAIREEIKASLIASNTEESKIERKITRDPKYLQWKIEELGTTTAIENISQAVGVLTLIIVNRLNLEATANLIQEMSFTYGGNDFLDAVSEHNDIFMKFKEEFNASCVDLPIDTNDVIEGVVIWVVDNLMTTQNANTDEDSEEDSDIGNDA